MHLVNVLADGGYLTENQPPYLNYDLPDFGTQVSWLEKHPTQGIAYCKERYGKDAAVAPTIHAVGTDVASRTEGDSGWIRHPRKSRIKGRSRLRQATVTFVDLTGEQSWPKRFSVSLNTTAVDVVADLADDGLVTLDGDRVALQS